MHELEFGNQTSNFSCFGENIYYLFKYHNEIIKILLIISIFRKTVKMLYSIRSPGYETLKLKLVCSFLLSPFQIALM